MLHSLQSQLTAAGVPLTTQPSSELPWWRAPEVSAALAALRLVRSSSDDEAAKLVLTAYGGVGERQLLTLSMEATRAERPLISMAAAAVRSGNAHGKLALLVSRLPEWQDLARTAGASPHPPPYTHRLHPPLTPTSYTHLLHPPHDSLPHDSLPHISPLLPP